ncbi:MAG: hypothetical protein Tsb0013_09410 [Phycisphaerales bacterium]
MPRSLTDSPFVRALSLCALAMLLALASGIAPRQPREPFEGVERDTLDHHAIVHATLIPAPGERVEDATIVIRGGVIQSVGAGMAPPAGARVWDARGMLVHSAFIESYLEVAAPELPEASEGMGRHWNPKVMAERSALEAGAVSGGDADRLRKMGFAVAHVAPDGGVFRGTGALVTLIPDGDDTPPESRILRERTGHVVALESGGFRASGYPGSKMGVIALIRQTLLDAEWYARTLRAHERDPRATPRPAPQYALGVLGEALPLIIPVGDELDFLRASRIAREFDREAVIVGSGDEYRRLEAVVAEGRPIVLPLAFADAPDVSTMGQRAGASLRELMMWEQSPTNARRLVDAGAEVVLTASRLPKGQTFFANLRKAIEHGLDEDRALAMLTTLPAELLGAPDRLGRVAPGYAANLVVADARTPFDEEREVRELWIDGVRHEIDAPPTHDYAGAYEVTLVNPTEPQRGPITLTIAKGSKGFSFEVTDETAEEPEPMTLKGRKVSVFENRFGGAVTDPNDPKTSAMVDFIVEGVTVVGTSRFPSGEVIAWTGTKIERDDVDADTDEGEDGDNEEALDVPASYGLPFGAYAFDEMPEQAHLVLRNATVWTADDAGIIEGGEVEIRGGEIVYVGRARRAAPSGATVLDMTGKHITPGLIDCHSHTGISGGVNEGTLSSTAMVRIADVINPDSIGWYRELAGGITAANQLHGSANAIGGQNSVVKLRWGCDHPDDMRVAGAIAGIKFALGENVKQSNWGSASTGRYPQTRMGVETFIRSRFLAAREYLDERARGGPAFRRDLELEALGEILEDDRLIHCHSYRQDEILMLCRVAQEFGFTIGTFQHVLEGYKVAEAIREAAIGGSSFADWWAYKFEVFDAIPENGAIMHDVGVVVSFNSDSDEMARRMNTEAAKAVKYGGVEPNEALKFVTLNAAKQLMIDDRTGSLVVGKDADLAVWSMDPLSSMARCERTFVDGRELFSLERDRALRERNNAEKQRLIQKILEDPDTRERVSSEAENIPDDNVHIGRDMIDGAPPEWILELMRAGGPGAHSHRPGTDDPLALEREYLWLIENGIDPDVNRPGECGCGRWAGYREDH